MILVALRLLTQDFITTPPYLFFGIGVISSAWLGGLKSGISSTVFALLAVRYFFLIPQYEFSIPNSEFALNFLYSLMMGIIISFIIDRLIKSKRALKRTYDELTLEKQRLKDIIEVLHDIVVVMDTKGVILESDDKLSRMVEEEIQGKHIIDTPPWSYSVLVQQKLSQSIIEALTDKPVSYDEKLKIGTDSFIDAQITIIPGKSENNEISYLLLSAVDITQRKVYEAELEQVNNIYNKLLNSNILGIVISDLKGKIIDMNDAFLKTVNYERKDFIENKINWNNLILGEYMDKSSKVIKELLDDGYTGPWDIEYITKSGDKVPVQVSAIMIDENDQTVLTLVQDISERKYLEQKKDEFISIASHEIKTPLTTIKGYLQLLGSKLKTRHEENVMFLSRMDNQIVRLTSLINDLLDVSRIQAGKLIFNMSEFNINNLVEESVADIKELAASHDISVFKPQSPQTVFGDFNRLAEVMDNLLSNAIKYSPKANKINVYIEDNKNEVRIIVEDFGVGIAEEDLSKLFKKFSRVEENDRTDWQEGLGLGLYISNEILKRHGSEIKVESQYGKGSRFYFSLSKVTG